MSSDAAKAMYPHLAKMEANTPKGQGSTWGVNAAEAMYGKKEPAPVNRGRAKVPMTAENYRLTSYRLNRRSK